MDTLRIWTAGWHHPIDLSCVLQFQGTLRHLELESRSIANDVRSVNLYSMENIVQIASRCVLLKTLSVPFDVSKYERKLWVSLGMRLNVGLRADMPLDHLLDPYLSSRATT